MAYVDRGGLNVYTRNKKKVDLMFENGKLKKELSIANDKLKKIEEYIKNKQVIDLDYVEKIIKGDEEE